MQLHVTPAETRPRTVAVRIPVPPRVVNPSVGLGRPRIHFGRRCSYLGFMPGVTTYLPSLPSRASRRAPGRCGRPPQPPVAPRRRRLPGWARFVAIEVGVWVGLYAAYLAVRMVAISGEAGAMANAREHRRRRALHRPADRDGRAGLAGAAPRRLLRLLHADVRPARGRDPRRPGAAPPRRVQASCRARCCWPSPSRASSSSSSPPPRRASSRSSASPTPWGSPAATTPARSAASSSTRTRPCRRCTSAGACSSA